MRLIHKYMQFNSKNIGNTASSDREKSSSFVVLRAFGIILKFTSFKLENFYEETDLFSLCHLIGTGILPKIRPAKALLTNELSKEKPKSLSSSDHLGPFCPIS